MKSCSVCGAPAYCRGLCRRCYAADMRGATPSVEPRKRAPGAWRKLQAHVDAADYLAAEKAARKANQSLSQWVALAVKGRLRK